MTQIIKTQFLSILLIGLLIVSGISVEGNLNVQNHEKSLPCSPDDVIRQGVSEVGRLPFTKFSTMHRLQLLEAWFNRNPLVVYARLIHNSITVKFIDGSAIVVIDPFPSESFYVPMPPSISLAQHYGTTNSPLAILLNPDEYVYGHHQCQEIIALLLKHDYRIDYLANDAVSLPYLRSNLSADIVFMNTHAGFFDTDGDQQADAVVIATGEPWTNDTETTYSFEYQHHMIVKGMIGQKSIIAFTPAFIEYYYPNGTFPDSLIYMATCFATYDDSMAQVFLDAGASAFVGWTQDTFFWINSRTSIQSFRFMARGWTVDHVCDRIQFGGFLNRLFHTDLIYYGDGQHQIPR